MQTHQCRRLRVCPLFVAGVVQCFVQLSVKLWVLLPSVVVFIPGSLCRFHSNRLNVNVKPKEDSTIPDIPYTVKVSVGSKSSLKSNILSL